MSSESRTSPQNPPDAIPPNRFPDLLISAFEVLRPLNCAITFASVLLGGWLGLRALPPRLSLAALSASLIAGGGNVLNDLCGIEEDRINKPGRPLPSGRLPVGIARLEAVFFLSFGLGCGQILPIPAPFIALVAALGLVLYNVWLKRVPLLGNLLVSAIGGLAFVYGGASVQAPLPALMPALFAFLFHAGREILKDLEDMAGDRLRKGSTLPLRWGRRNARIFACAAYLLVILSTPWPGISGPYGIRYLSLVFALDILLAYVIFGLWRARTPDAFRRLSGLLKIGMLLGLCAFFLDTL